MSTLPIEALKLIATTCNDVEAAGENKTGVTCTPIINREGIQIRMRVYSRGVSHTLTEYMAYHEFTTMSPAAIVTAIWAQVDKLLTYAYKQTAKG